MIAMQRFLYLIVLLYLPTLAFAEIYKWVDERGHIHYGDSCPLPHCESESKKAMPPPSDEQVRQSQERFKNIKERQQKLEQIRKEKEAEKQSEKEAKQKELAETRRQCALAHQNLHTLQRQRSVYTIDDKGKYIYIGDEERTNEIQRLIKFIEENCN